MKYIVCKEREAEVPDRNKMGSLKKRVCRECHAERLKGDLKHILKVHEDQTKGR